ncbi:MAG: L,D-transpeptidase [Chitinivibrionales bacterium]
MRDGDIAQKREDLENVRAHIRGVCGTVPDRYIVVDTARQRLAVINNENTKLEFPVSTSRFGTGNKEGSFMTPPGVHRVCEKIGNGAPAGRIFRDRIDTGEDWPVGKPGENLILSRILRLEGLEQGLNKGKGIDSYERYIYIHGTNNEDRIGRPLSQGCVCMKNDDIIRVFDSIEVGAIVFIN